MFAYGEAMRSEWLGGSAAVLVIGSIALTLAFATTPFPQDQPISVAAATAEQAAGQWMTSAAALFLASVGLTLGLPALLWLMTGRDRWLGPVAVCVFAIGTVGMSGYATALVLLRALLVHDSLAVDRLDALTADAGTEVWAIVWLGCFMLGLVLIAVGLWRARTVPRWVPVVLLGFVASQVVPFPGGSTGTVVQFAVLTVGLTGASIAANDAAHSLDRAARGHFPPGPPRRS